MRRERLLPALLWGIAVAMVPAGFLHFLGNREVYFPGWVHFGVVTAAAMTATGAALALTIVGARRRDGRVVLLATAFTVMASLLFVHGLATPDFIVGQNGLVALTGGLTLPAGGAVLALSALSWLGRPQHVRSLLWLQAVLVTGIVAISAVGLASPAIVPGVPSAMSPEAVGLLAAGLTFYGLLALRALRTFLLTHRTADLLVVVGIAWLGAALVAALTLSYVDLGWWVGHGLEIVAIGLIGGVVAWDLHRGAQSRPLMGDLRAGELVAAEEAFLGSHVRALMVRLAEKDEYTEGHTRRVAQLAVRVGERLGLPPGRLRHLAAGGLLHDIGKLSVPDEILKKPGPLTDEEYAVILRHPERGFRLLGELGGFPEPVRRLVRGHHERLDGSGYPQGLHAADLDPTVRILGVCDVYDALVSTRVYRDAWTHEAALELLRSDAGKELDTHCVEALEKVLEEADAKAPPQPVHAPAEPEPDATPLVEEPVTTPLLPSVPTVFAGTPGRIVRRP